MSESSDTMCVWELLTCGIGTDGPVDLVFPENLRGKRTGVARSVGVHEVQVDGRRVLVAESGSPLLDHRAVVILVQETDDQSARPRGGDSIWQI